MKTVKPERKNILADRRGQSIVEITLITPLLLIALYVPFDFGIALFTAHLTQNAVREGARIGATVPDPSGSCTMPCSGQPAGSVLAEIRERMPERLSDATITVTLSGASGAACMRTITVSADGNYPFGLYRLMGLFGFVTDLDLPITRSTEIRYELQPYAPSTKC
ncbi:MAG: hypothetical protein GEU77_04830 [Deltaproteobacteria bacterium]|nr:hypothetical protein [Deltaproteobacteria bacterium]